MFQAPVGFRGVHRNGDFATQQTKLIEDGLLDLAHSCSQGQAERPWNEGSGLPFLSLTLNVEGGGDDAVVFIRACAGVAQDHHGHRGRLGHSLTSSRRQRRSLPDHRLHGLTAGTLAISQTVPETPTAEAADSVAAS
ncbi:hypothetical protein BS78_10G047800 [Paspalum vaginatum]|nr:hypothetical protein BS78_10G047800 [Paspalum vaginatum]